jgi:hypothetical protein
VKIDGGALKILSFMIRDPSGCDAWITPTSFVIQFGWNDAHHKYVPEIAPAILQWLREMAPDGVLRGSSLPYWGAAPGHWSYGNRFVWIDEQPERIVVMIRDAGDHAERGERPLPFPAPIERPPEFIAGVHACPHCGVVPERYRKFSDGALACLACGASSRG